LVFISKSPGLEIFSLNPGLLPLMSGVLIYLKSWVGTMVKLTIYCIGIGSKTNGLRPRLEISTPKPSDSISSGLGYPKVLLMTRTSRHVN